MDALLVFLERLKKEPALRGHFRGFLHVLIGRRITTVSGVPVSTGLTWRDLSTWLKRLRWPPECIEELDIPIAELAPRDRQKFWYQVISRAEVDSAKARDAGERFTEVLATMGYKVV